MIKRVFAATFEPITGEGPFQGGGENPGATMESFFTVLLGFLTIIGGIMFLIYFVLGGLAWISSRGDRELVAKAQRYMSNSLIGLVFIILAWAFTGIVGAALGIDILNLAANITGIGP